jgi:hypothetical protein
MKQMTISFYDHFIHFCDYREIGKIQVPENFQVMDDTLLQPCFDRLKQGVDLWVWYHRGFRRIADYCTQHYTYVKAAGGVAKTPNDEVLLIRREGFWDIPKGMVEPGENLAQAALREVREETGIARLSLGPLITKTYHLYDKYGGWHLKQTSWFHMSASEKQSTLPQREEGITEALWVSTKECC